MKVKFISCTRPSQELIDQGVQDLESLIAFVARVSNPTNQLNTMTSRKLIKYLIKHRHWSPLEMIDVTLEIETTRDIARQMLRHKSFVFQEFSQRYADIAAFGETFEISEARLQDHNNRQNSVETDDIDLQDWWHKKQMEISTLSLAAYREAIEKGIAKEVARKILPEGLTKSRLYMKGSIRSWIHYLEVRGPGSGTQKEHMQVAECILRALTEVFPMGIRES